MRVATTDAQARPLLAIEGEEIGHALRVDGPPVVLPDGSLGLRVVNSWGNPVEFAERLQRECVGHVLVPVAPEEIQFGRFTWGNG